MTQGWLLDPDWLVTLKMSAYLNSANSGRFALECYKDCYYLPIYDIIPLLPSPTKA